MKHNATRDILITTLLVGLQMFMDRMQPELYNDDYLHTPGFPSCY